MISLRSVKSISQAFRGFAKIFSGLRGSPAIFQLEKCKKMRNTGLF